MAKPLLHDRASLAPSAACGPGRRKAMLGDTDPSDLAQRAARAAAASSREIACKQPPRPEPLRSGSAMTGPGGTGRRREASTRLVWRTPLAAGLWRRAASGTGRAVAAEQSHRFVSSTTLEPTRGASCQSREAGHTRTARSCFRLPRQRANLARARRCSRSAANGLGGSADCAWLRPAVRNTRPRASGPSCSSAAIDAASWSSIARRKALSTSETKYSPVSALGAVRSPRECLGAETNGWPRTALTDSSAAPQGEGSCGGKRTPVWLASLSREAPAPMLADRPCSVPARPVLPMPSTALPEHKAPADEPSQLGVLERAGLFPAPRRRDNVL